MKKLVTIFICLMLCMGLGGCTKHPQDTTLRIASEILSGNFMDGFSASDYDTNILEMIHGYATYDYDENGSMVLNEVPVKEVSREVDATTGNVRYDYTIADDLKWSDGHPLTAADYVFAILFDSSCEWMDAGAMNANYDHVLGYEEYNAASGEDVYFPGVLLIDETHFSIILDGAKLPYFNEMLLAAVSPKPLHIFTDGKGTILTTEAGSRLKDYSMDDAVVYAKEEYRSAPSISCGPYVFVSYEDHVVTLKRNTYFLGDFRHQIPEIDTILIKEMDTSLHVSALINGDVDLITGVLSDEDLLKIQEEDAFTIKEFAGKAYGNLAFACDFGPAADMHVRRALSYMIDKHELIQTVYGGRASLVSSDYVPAQWMAQEKEEALEQLHVYDFHLEKAKEELEQSGYVYEADGKTLFDSNKIQKDGSYLRHNEKGEALVIRHLGTSGNAVTDVLQLQITQRALDLGMRFEVDYGDFAALSMHYYEGASLGDERVYHSFNLANVLPPGYDPYYNYHSQFAGTPMNPTGIRDDELDAALEVMEMSDPTQRDDFLDAWMTYEERFHEILPVIPLYISNEYAVHAKNIENVNVNTMEGYGHIITGVRMQ